MQRIRSLEASPVISKQKSVNGGVMNHQPNDLANVLRRLVETAASSGH